MKKIYEKNIYTNTFHFPVGHIRINKKKEKNIYVHRLIEIISSDIFIYCYDIF